MFEFSPAKNRGVDYFTVDMELKPFQPYIHVAPKWNEGGLYGIRENDPIGLICGGDFGLTMISDAWQTYERQNKNYQNIFDRQIQNLEVQRNYGRVADVVGGIAGTGQGATSGAMMGGMKGGPKGAIAGGVIGGVLSAVGGVADFAINEALRSENMDYTKDLFGYQLGNIRALPDTLSRVNSFNPNNKIFPILEFYGCSEEETEALKQKIKYNGMSIGRIGKLRDFVNPEETTYIKGQLIVLDELPEDSHLANDIANEIYKGVRI
jgi:outer membrane lipoprotein SlyB